jgi:hypothetical protein
MGTVPPRLFEELFPSTVWLAGGEKEAPGGMADVQPYPVTESQLRALSVLAKVKTREQRRALEVSKPMNGK